MLRPCCLWGLLATLTALACGGKATDHPHEGPLPSAPAVPMPSAVGGRDRTGGASTGGTASATQPTAAAGAAGDASSASSAGAGGADPCVGVEPSCIAGEILCDPRLGVTATCNGCGVPEPLANGTRCARLIASDKESNLVCVVLGSTELQCWPTWGSVTVGAVPSGALEMFLNDDSTSTPLDPVHPCLRLAPAEYSCFPGTLGVTRVAVGDYGACAISDGRALCRGILAPGKPPYPLLDITITDGDVWTLSSAGFAPGDWQPRKPDFWQGTPSSLRVDHREAGCIISTLDEMACWDSASAPLERSAWSGYRKWLPMTLPRACALDAEGRIGCGDVLKDAAPTPLDAENVIDFAASSSLVCALTRQGHVQCWDATATQLEVPKGW